jgi:hypothetical protein
VGASSSDPTNTTGLALGWNRAGTGEINYANASAGPHKFQHWTGAAFQDAAITAKDGSFSGPVFNTASTIQYLGSAGGSADALTATPSPAITAYTSGALYFVKATAQNATTTPTIAISGLAAKTIVKRASTALAAADILDGMILQLMYDGTNMQLLNPVVN